MSKKIAMIIASQKFRDEEYAVPKKVFEDNGFEVTTASSTTSVCKGMLGAAVATTVGVIAISVGQLIEVWFLFRFLPYDLTFWKPAAAGAFSYAVTYAYMHSSLQSGSLTSVLLGATLCVSAYAGAIGLLGFSLQEKLLLRRLYKHLGRFTILQRDLGP